MAKGCLIFVGLATIGLMVFCGTAVLLLPKVEPLTAQEKAATKKASEEHSRIRAQERLIKSLFLDTLKTPSTAKVQLESGWNKKSPEELITRGTVDAQNSFGTMIRSKVYALSHAAKTWI